MTDYDCDVIVVGAGAPGGQCGRTGRRPAGNAARRERYAISVNAWM
jgi:hypothetical protein